MLTHLISKTNTVKSAVSTRLLLLLFALLPLNIHANTELVTRTMCLFDLIGQKGPMANIVKDYQTQALHWGVKLELKHYTNDRLAAEDYEAGHCDLVNLPGIRARTYNAFTGSINAIGAIPDYQQLRTVLQTLAQPKASKFMQQNDHEIAAVIPTGALYGFVIDKRYSNPGQLAGKKIAVLDNAPESNFLIKQTGMIPVPSSINNAIQKFNNHQVDMTGAPAAAYELLEMHRGLEPNGGVIDWPLHQTTIQIVIRKDKFPDAFEQNSRNYALTKLDESFQILEKFEQSIPQQYWIHINQDYKNQWQDKHRLARLSLRNQGIYHTTALTLFRKVRCKFDPNLSECSIASKE